MCIIKQKKVSCTMGMIQGLVYFKVLLRLFYDFMGYLCAINQCISLNYWWLAERRSKSCCLGFFGSSGFSHCQTRGLFQKRFYKTWEWMNEYDGCSLCQRSIDPWVDVWANAHLIKRLGYWLEWLMCWCFVNEIKIHRLCLQFTGRSCRVMHTSQWYLNIKICKIKVIDNPSPDICAIQHLTFCAHAST